MFIAKVVSVVVVGILTAITARRLLNEVNAAKARVHVKNTQQQNAVTRLRQDPATGIYYPVE
jgi:type II secretory pathway pseudopilin PulG